MRLDQCVIDHCLNIFTLQLRNFVNLVRTAKAVKEVQEGDTCLKCCCMGNQGQILCFLNGVGGKQGKASRTCRHYIGMIAKDGESLRCKRTRCHMKYC